MKRIILLILAIVSIPAFALAGGGNGSFGPGDPPGTAASLISDTIFGAGWNGVTTIAPSQNAVYDQMILKATIDAPTFTTSVTSSNAIISQTQTSLPTCACSGGGACALVTGDTDESGTMTCSAGGSSTTATLTFNLTHGKAPVCMGLLHDGAIAYNSTRSTTAPVLTFSAKTNPTIDYICR